MFDNCQFTIKITIVILASEGEEGNWHEFDEKKKTSRFFMIIDILWNTNCNTRSFDSDKIVSNIYFVTEQTVKRWHIKTLIKIDACDIQIFHKLNENVCIPGCSMNI